MEILNFEEERRQRREDTKQLVEAFERQDKPFHLFLVEFFDEDIEALSSKYGNTEVARNLNRLCLALLFETMMVNNTVVIYLEDIIRILNNRTRFISYETFIGSENSYEFVDIETPSQKKEDTEIAKAETSHHRLASIVASRSIWTLQKIKTTKKLCDYVEYHAPSTMRHLGPQNEKEWNKEYRTFLVQRIELKEAMIDVFNEIRLKERTLENKLVQYDDKGQYQEDGIWYQTMRLPSIEIDIIEGKKLKVQTQLGYLSAEGAREKKRPETIPVSKDEVAYINSRNEVPFKISTLFIDEKLRVVRKRLLKADEEQAEANGSKGQIVGQSNNILENISRKRKIFTKENKPFYVLHRTDKVGRIYDVNDAVSTHSVKYIAELIVPFASYRKHKLSDEQGAKSLIEIYASIGEIVQKEKHNHKDRTTIGRKLTAKYRKKKKLNIKKLIEDYEDEKHLIHLIDLVHAAICYERKKYIKIAINRDATNQVFQLIGALFRDKRLLQNVNIGGDDKFKDSYAKFAKIFQLEIEGELKLDRKIFKKPVMTFGYGSGAGIKQIKANVLDEPKLSGLQIDSYIKRCTGTEKVSEQQHFFASRFDMIGTSIREYVQIAVGRNQHEFRKQKNLILLPDGYKRHNISSAKETYYGEPIESEINIYSKSDKKLKTRILLINKFIKSYETPEPLNFAANFIHSFDAYIARTLFNENIIIDSQHDSFKIWAEDADELLSRYIGLLEEISNSDILEINDKIWEKARKWKKDLPKEQQIEMEKKENEEKYIGVIDREPASYYFAKLRQTKEKLSFDVNKCKDALT